MPQLADQAKSQLTALHRVLKRHRAMTMFGLSSKREITRTSIRVRTAIAARTREQGRYPAGRPPYGYLLADAGPHLNRATCRPAGTCPCESR